MALRERLTVLVSPELRERLRRRAKKEGVSLGELVRQACEERLTRAPLVERRKAIEELIAMSLPIDTPAGIRRKSAPDREDCGE